MTSSWLRSATLALFLLGAALSTFALFVWHRASMFESNQMKADVSPALEESFAAFDFDAALSRLAAAVRLKTVSYEVNEISAQVFFFFKFSLLHSL